MAAAAVTGLPPLPAGYSLEPMPAPAAAAPAAPAEGDSGLPPLPDGYALEHPYDKLPAPVLKRAVSYDRNDPRFTHEAEGVAATIRGVPLLGAGVEKAGAGISALVHPLTGVGSDKATLGERYRENLEQEEAAKTGYEEEHPIENIAAGTLGGGLALGGVGGASAGAAKALGMTGKLIPASIRAATSGAALGAGDAALRGEDPLSAGEAGALTGVGGVVAGKVVGKVWDAAARAFRKAPVEVANSIDVNGIKVPVRESALTGDLATSQEEQAVMHGARGDDASRMAQQHTEASDAALQRAQDDLASGLDPTGAAPKTSPQAAGETVSAELGSQEAGRAAAETARSRAVEVERAALRDRMLAGPTNEAGTVAGQQGGAELDPRASAEAISGGLQAAATRAGAARDAAYGELRATPGEYNPAGFRGAAEKIKQGLNGGPEPVRVDTTTPQTARMIDDIESNVGDLRFENRAEPRPTAAAPIAPESASHAQNIADLRRQFGDQVADAYARQNAAPVLRAAGSGGKSLPRDLATAKPRYGYGAKQFIPQFANDTDKALYIAAQSDKSARDADFRGWLKSRGYSDSEINVHGQAVRNAIKELAKTADEGPLSVGRVAPAPRGASASTGVKTQSLLEFLASKGGLGPDSELDAIGAHTHTVNVDGIGRRKLVRQGGWPLDYAREAAEEAGYLRGDHKGTSGVNDLLDAVDAEMRGQKRYPEGLEGHQTGREAAAMGERERHELEAHTAGLESDLAAAGHGHLGPDVKARAISLMDRQGMDADSAVEHALHQMEVEDAAGHHGGDFPGDRPADAAPSARPITLDTIDSARKRLISMAQAANDTARATGNYTDARGARRVLKAFDDHVRAATRAPGGFSGDAERALSTMDRARALHADIKRTYGPQNPQDDVGKAIRKIIGDRNTTPAEIEAVAPMLYGNASEPGGPLQTRIARRVRDIFGESSPQWQAYRQGLISHLTEAAPGLEPLSNEKIADRLHRFFSGTKGVGLAQTLFSPSERAQFLAHANRLRTAIDPGPEGAVDKLLAKWSGRDGGERASAKTVIDGLMGSSGKKGMAPQIVERLKSRLSPAGITQLKQGVWSRITEPPEGMLDWGHQKQGQRIMDFLKGDGKGLADSLFTKGERDKMENIAAAHLKMVPVPGSTNPSGSGHVAARLARSAAHSILPFVGLHAGGLPGVAGAVALDKAAGRVLDRRAANKAVKLFYGQQKRGAPTTLPQRFGALGGAVIADQSR